MTDSTEEAKRKLKEGIARRKEEARLKKEKEEQEKQQAKLQQEQELAKQQGTLSERIRRHKEEVQAQKIAEEQAAKLAKEKEEEEKQQIALKLKADIQNRKQTTTEVNQAARSEREIERQKEADEIKRAKEEQKRIIEQNKAEKARQKELEAQEKASKSSEEQERLNAEKEEKKRRRQQQLEEQRAEKEQAEAERKRQQEEMDQKRENERKEAKRKREEELQRQKQEAEELERIEKEKAAEAQRVLEEQQREAVRRHKEEVRARLDAEKDLEEEDRKKREAEFAAEFEEGQRRRKEEMERTTQLEQERQKKAAERIKQLGLTSSSPINRVGLFSNFGEEPGLEIWVLGDQQISKIAKKKHGLRGLIGESYGSFNVEKLYIALQTSFSQGAFHYRIYTWSGSRSTEEMRNQLEERLAELESGLALSDLEKISREFERDESDEFRALFEQELEYVEPVILKATVGPNYQARSLYQLKGRYQVHCKRVDPVPESLNSGDVFVLEDSFGIYQFNGKKSNKMERGKALDYGVQLRIERNARVRVHIIDEGNPQSEHENNKFWAVLLLDRDSKGEFIVPEGAKVDSSVTGATPTGLEVPIKSVEESGDDIQFENDYIKSWKLFKISPKEIPEDLSKAEDLEIALSQVEFDQKVGPNVSVLDEWSTVVLDCQTEIFVWYGNFSSQKARAEARQKAKELLSEPGRATCTVVTKVRQRTEAYIFKEKFTGSWGEYADFDFTEEHVRGNIANLKQEEVNIDCMYHPEKYAIASEDKRLPIPNKDNSAQTTTKIFLVGNHDKIALNESEYGHFFSSNCYLLIYEIQLGQSHGGGNMTRNIVYFWQGRHASREDKGLSALLAGDVAKKLRFCQVERVVQNKEPTHFLSHFNPFIVHIGVRFHDAKFLLCGSKRLFEVRGTNEIDTIAIESIPEGVNLNTNDSFVLIFDQHVFIWNGAHTNSFKRDAANRIAEQTKQPAENIFTVEEGDEGEAFWEILGGKTSDYFSNEKVKAANVQQTNAPVKFFECTNIIGIFKVYEFEHFAQEDLLPKNCAIIDVGHKIFVWVGTSANAECEKMTLETAQKYLDFENEDTPKRKQGEIVVVKANSEPLEFKSLFHTWDIRTVGETKGNYQSRIERLRATHVLNSPLPSRKA